MEAGKITLPLFLGRQGRSITPPLYPTLPLSVWVGWKRELFRQFLLNDGDFSLFMGAMGVSSWMQFYALWLHVFLGHFLILSFFLSFQVLSFFLSFSCFVISIIVSHFASYFFFLIFHVYCFGVYIRDWYIKADLGCRKALLLHYWRIALVGYLGLDFFCSSRSLEYRMSSSATLRYVESVPILYLAFKVRWMWSHWVP